MNGLNDFSDSLRPPEYQAVLVVDYDDGRMFPLTEDMPKCLLPIGNRRLLAYQLDMLSHSGIAEVFIVAPKEYEAKLSHFLGEYIRTSMNIDLVTVEDMYGSADCLRAVRERIRGDFFCLHSDFISQYCLGELASLHRLSTSDLAMMLTVAGSDVKKDEVDEEFIGICNDGRILLKMPALEVDETIELVKPLLHNAHTLSLRQDLVDLGIYVMSHWVLEFLADNSRISSIRTDLLPYLINRQHQPASRLLDLIPALEHRHRPLKAIEPWILGSHSICMENKGESVLQALESEPNTPADAHSPAPAARAGIAEADADDSGSKIRTHASTAATSAGSKEDLLRCFALVYEPPPRVEVAGTATNVTVLGRVVNIATYLNANKDIILHKNTQRTPWPRFANLLKKELSLVGEGTTDVIAEKTITVKQCCIGANCKIGVMAKLNNCVIMDNVTIGDNCTVQNSIICDKVVIENNCKLNDCNIGSGYRVVTGSKVKGESFSSTSH